MSPVRDRITLETPDNISLQFPLATFGQRSVAFIIDLFIYGAIVTSLFFLILWLSTSAFVLNYFNEFNIPVEDFIIVLISISGFLIAIDAYFVLQEFFSKGQTFGKKAMKIRVLRLDGRHITIREALIRGISRTFLDLFPGSFMVGFVSYFCTSNQQRIGDLIAGTVVVTEEYQNKLKPHAFIEEIELKPVTKVTEFDNAIKKLMSIYLIKARTMSIEQRNEYSRLILEKVHLSYSDNLAENEIQIYNYLKDNFT